jgi:hypothetical protein
MLGESLFKSVKEFFSNPSSLFWIRPENRGNIKDQTLTWPGPVYLSDPEEGEWRDGLQLSLKRCQHDRFYSPIKNDCHFESFPCQSHPLIRLPIPFHGWSIGTRSHHELDF